MAKQEDFEQTESKKKNFFNFKTLLIILPILLFQIVFAIIIMNKIIKPKLQYSSTVSESTKSDQVKLGKIYFVNDVIVNPRDTVGRRYVNVSVGLDCNSGSALGKLEKNEVKVRDYFITLFSNCTFDELDDAADKAKLRKKIQSDLNKMISKQGIQAVYFTNFVLQ